MPHSIPHEFIDPQTSIGIPIETIEQKNRRELIARNMMKSESMRRILEANRARKLAIANSSASVGSSPRPLSALPAFAEHDMSCTGSILVPCHRTLHKAMNADGVSSEPRGVDLVEFACGDESTIGILGPKLGVSVCRLTLNTCNLTSKLGFRKALSIVRANHGASMHSSTPCTPWSTWNHMNSHKLGHAFNLKLATKRAESLQMLTYFSFWRKRLWPMAVMFHLSGHVFVPVGNWMSLLSSLTDSNFSL